MAERLEGHSRSREDDIKAFVNWNDSAGREDLTMRDSGFLLGPNDRRAGTSNSSGRLALGMGEVPSSLITEGEPEYM